MTVFFTMVFAIGTVGWLTVNLSTSADMVGLIRVSRMEHIGVLHRGQRLLFIAARDDVKQLSQNVCMHSMIVLGTLKSSMQMEHFKSFVVNV